MQNHLLDSTASYKSGIGPNQRLFRVPSGEYAGRIVVLLAVSSSEIKIAYSDYPFAGWNEPTAIISDGADYPFDAVMDGDGNIYLCYTFGSNHDLVIRKLSFFGGLWSAGSLNTIYNGDDNYFPSLAIESNGRLWVSYSRLSGGVYYINAKYSDDWGTTWNLGTSSPGTTLSSSGGSAYSKVVVRESYVYCIYNVGGTVLAYRRKHFNISTWDTEIELAGGSGLDYHFDVAVSADGKIGVVFDDSSIKFREYDGNIWSSLCEIDSSGGSFPQIRYFDNIPYIVYLSGAGSGQYKILYTCRLSTIFPSPALLDSRKNVLSKVFCYCASSGNYRDLTTAAGNDTSGDIYHTESGAIFKYAGDAIYMGMDEKYNYLKILLSTIGSGGTIGWQYYNGQDWCGFTPCGGAFHFDTADKELLLWDDYAAWPVDWQKKIVNGIDKFWIKIAVLTPYTTAPIGSRITAITNISALLLME
jgi:hypothetical protein